MGEVRLLPDASGGIAGAVVGLGTPTAQRRTRFGLAKAALALPAGDWALHGSLSDSEATEAALGWLLAGYRFTRYRPTDKPAAPARLVCPPGVDAARLTAMAKGEALTRDLINTPAEDMGPDQLEAAVAALATRFGATTTAIRGDDLLAQNFPMIHAVGRASPRAPRLLELTWGTTGPKVTLVGKGVCFDTGGLNLKPSAGMNLMKKDMGGAATVLGLAQMIMTLDLPLRLCVLIPAVENVVAGNALKPKDILTSRKGLTVEVNDTDAEGRLILADTLAYACEGAPDLLVSMATLTGAARVAVGPDLAPYYTDDARLAAALEAGALAGFDPVPVLARPDAGIAIGLQFERDRQPVGLARAALLHLAHLGGGAEYVLDMVAIFMRHHIDARKIATCAHLLVHQRVKIGVDVDAVVSRAIEWPHGALRSATAGIAVLGIEHQLGRLERDVGLLEQRRPCLVERGQRVAAFAAEFVGGTAFSE
ncbi:MAG: hypothetical protein B7X92_09330 [Novosphingobium sp. 17-62-9]|nr:MAG: hypothetical protein B7X92_09330 [Novosphingobium sp. 17-62-9]